jgi:RNA polymerase sigma factor (sigma-70 family)
MARLDPEKRTFYGRLYEAARAGCMKSLRSTGCSEEEADEILSWAVLEVIEEVDPISRGFAPPQMVNYLKRTCRNHLIAEWRHRGVLPVIDLEQAGSVGDNRAMGLEQEAATHETIDEIYRALRTLPERERVIFCQRHLQGLSPDEIQRSAGVSERTYRKLIERANAKVRAHLERGEEN